MRFAIELLWVRPGKVGGTEFVIRNLLNGMEQLQDAFEAVLVVSKDNAETFRHYTDEDKRYSLLIADVESANISKRIIWQNLHLNALLRKNDLRLCFSPVYDRPYFTGGISYINTIHDIQAYHYPEYHPFHEVAYSKMMWRSIKRGSDGVICISKYVEDDIAAVYKFDRSKMTVIYNPVSIGADEFADFALLSEKYGIKKGQYYYTVGQLIPHKNMPTLLKVMKKIIDDNIDLPRKLLISGINGNAAKEINETIDKLGLHENVILTGFVQNNDRNTLYKNAAAFLFPSVFEGFGIPPIEAMMCGSAVVAARMTCVPEVTQNLAEYVDDPYSVDEWIEKMSAPVNRSSELDTSRYDLGNIAQEYMDFLRKTWKIADERTMTV